jgi:hypothetical protein
MCALVFQVGIASQQDVARYKEEKYDDAVERTHDNQQSFSAQCHILSPLLRILSLVDKVIKTPTLLLIQSNG